MSIRPLPRLVSSAAVKDCEIRKPSLLRWSRFEIRIAYYLLYCAGSQESEIFVGTRKSEKKIRESYRYPAQTNQKEANPIKQRVTPCCMLHNTMFDKVGSFIKGNDPENCLLAQSIFI